MANIKSNTKSKRRLSLKGKKIIRRVLAGILLISALVVASIPSDNSGVTYAAATSDPINYVTDSALSRNGDLNYDSSTDLRFLDPSYFSNRYYSYDVRELDGQYVLLWKYQYYTDDGTYGNPNPGTGIVCDYNDSYAVDELNLTSQIYRGYDIVSQSTFNNYVTGTLNNYTFVLKSPYTDCTLGNNAASNATVSTYLDEVKAYFPSDYAAWKAEYDAAAAQYAIDNGGAQPNSTDDLTTVSPLTCYGNKMTEENKKIYYCDHHTGTGGSTNLTGFTLKEVSNLAKNMKYYDNSGTEYTIPNEDVIYIVYKNTDAAQTVNLDKNGFNTIGTVPISAISKNAFEATLKVTDIIVGQSIAYIGDDAFRGSFIQTVEFNSVLYIGNRVFKDCEYLTEVTITEHTTTLGKEAFYGCKVLENISIPDGVNKIGFGCFANCSILKNVDMSTNHGVNIGEYAFFNCPYLESVIFPESYTVSLGKACFALDEGTGSGATLTSFTFPKKLGQYISASDGVSTPVVYDSTGTSHSDFDMGDYILANRNNLLTVYMPKEFGDSDVDWVPLNTFDNCNDLESVRFYDTNNRLVKFEDSLFADVSNPDFYVYGPELTTTTFEGSNYACPRRCTWECSTQVASYVPYVYYADGKDHYEVGIAPYRYELEVNSDGTARILNCSFTVANPSVSPLTVPGDVAGYKIKEMAEGCFDPIKDYISVLTIADDSLEQIDDNVFYDCDNLSEIIIGNSVKNIGEGTFANNANLTKVTIGSNIENIDAEAFYACPQLTDVWWDSPDNYSKLTNIGSDAFYTGGNTLYFHGDIIEGYLPFDYAMGSNKINASSVRVCYKSLSPTNFTCIYDEMSNQVLLLDYPHFCDLPYEIKTKYANGDPLNDEEMRMLNATMFISVPSAIESVDIASFLDSDNNNTNKKNWVYVPQSLNDLGTTYDRMTIYGEDNLILSLSGSTELASDYYANDGGYTPGLFSGYMYETPEIGYYGDDASGLKTKGNDWILAVELPGVQSIPDYCFDSCERLQSVIIGDDCEQIGESAFHGCDNLITIGTNANPKYTFDNYILYEKNADNTYEINTCLPARGENATSDEIWVNSQNDPLLSQVSSMHSGAFAGCEYIAKADLSDTTVGAIPQRAFDGCTRLTEVILPDTVRSIGKESFDNGATTLDITIPCDTNISDEAFDPDKTVTIRTYPECTITSAYDPIGYDKIYIQFIDADYVITYLNDDLTVFARVTVPAGYSGSYPETDPTPKLESHNGYSFSYWYFDNSQGIRNVNENRQALAIFVAPSVSQNNANGNGNNGSGNNSSGGNNGNNNNNGSGNNNNSASNNSASSNNAKYNVIVENGAGGGSYAPGTVVTITAYAATGKQFDKWTTSNTNMGFSNAYNISTTFIMPAADVKVTATYKNQNSTSGNNAGSGNNGNGSLNGNNNGNSGTNNGSGGTTVTVTSEAIDNNNKNKASAQVAGSTDNFVVKITDSANATAQVEAALRAKYGDDLSGIRFVAFDISLYDETGTYLIENNDNLAVTITIPIPDELAYYAGNNKAAAVINGQIDDKYVKFTTIDGVPCMTFVATHFSPYTVYVDTNNLTSGVADLTPKTGVAVQPKWFLSAGLGLFGIVLLLWKDKKKIVKSK